MMKHVLGAVAALSLGVLGPPAMAAVFGDPAKLVAAYYATYDTKQDEFPDVDQQRAMQSARLNGLYDKDAKEADGEVGRIDFDPFINGQDYEIKNLVIGQPYLAGGKAIVHVTFENFETPQDMGLSLVSEGGGWKIDDVWGGSVEYSYDLLDILEAPLP